MKSVKKTPLEEKLTSKPKFVPGKSYKWEPEDEFVLNGNEFSMMYSYFRSKLPEAQAVINSFQALQAIFEEGVSEGIIKEMDEKEEQNLIVQP